MSMVTIGSVAASTEATPEGTYFSAQKREPYSATNMSRAMIVRLRHWIAVGLAAPLMRIKTVQQDSRRKEARSGSEQRRKLLDGDTDGKERCAPQHINGKEREDQADPVGFRPFLHHEIANH